ncbi:MAG: site-specific integrase [Actinomycetota bacterium]|nr:site-specific integrase [Actinomycetota bacterium]
MATAFVEKHVRSYPDGRQLVTWRARYRDPSGKEHAKTFARKVDAERYLTSVEADLLRGNWIDPDRGKTPLGDWAKRWLESKRSLKPKTRLGYESLLRSRVLPKLGDYPLASIERIHVEQWISQMQDEDLSSSRIRQAFNVLAAALDAAIANGMIARNVARGIDLPRLRPAKRRFLTQGQVAALANAIYPNYRVLVLVLAYSGLRWGEAIALRRGRCDLLRRRLHVLESATEVGGDLLWGSPKTHRVRSVSLPAFVCEELAQHLAAKVEDHPDALVFTTDSGMPVRHSDFLRYRWRSAVQAAGLPEGLTPHELRHTAAALLINSGAGPKSIQAQLGHSTIVTTFDIYGHLFEGHLDDVMDRLDQAWRREAETQSANPPAGHVVHLPRGGSS